MNKEDFQKSLKKITRTAFKLSEQKVLNDRRWTLEVKNEFGKLGLKNKYQVAATGFTQSYDREWLYDLVWYSNNENGQLIDVPFVLECEWGNIRNVQFDFEKLLIANASIKFMICQASNESQRVSLIHYFKDAIEQYHSKHPKQNYFIAILDAINDWSFEVIEL